MTKKILALFLFLAFAFLVVQFVTANNVSDIAAADEKPIIPLDNVDEEVTADQDKAQQLAMNDERVHSYRVGARTEVFAVYSMGEQFPAEYSQCTDGSCYQVDMYDFDHNASIISIVHVNRDKVLDVLHVPGGHPQVNQRLYDHAVALIREDADVTTTLGYQPAADQIRLMAGFHKDTACDGGHLCAAAVFFVDSGTVWVLVDLNEDRVAKIWWADRNPEPDQSTYDRGLTPEDCGTTLDVNRDGWSLKYLTTPNDSLNVTNVTYDGSEVATSIKLLEWHAHYPGDWGFVDYTGCGGGSGGFAIYPFGPTQVEDMYNGAEYVGFEVVQDFRMGNWGASCNYRYEQHFQFFTDGRWRVVTGAFGQGCGDDTDEEATYRPVVRIDIAVDGDANDSLDVWNGASWVDEADEGWWDHLGSYTPDGYRFRVLDQSGDGYYVKPGKGNFNDGGTGDNAYFYATLYKTAEGAVDMPSIGTCCNDNHEQGPHNYVNSESIDNENVVLWYVPQSETITSWQVSQGGARAPYCWTDNTSNTWPCFSGPMFIPSCSAETAVAPIPTITPDNNNVQLTWDDDPANGGGYEVWRSTDPNFDIKDIGSQKIYDGDATSFSDVGALGDSAENYTYIVRSKNCTGDLGANSDRVGEFDFDLTLGSE